jgi:tetraacyldisaccharide 4'-kinase
VSVPVISVGNLTLGGTGKTPMVKWIARWLQANGGGAAIVSRGYGAAVGEQNDEALELAQALPNVPHIQNRDRVAGAQQAISNFAADCIVLDDGFQHRRLGRDLDIVLLDALEPFGFEHVFPRGTLREPPVGLQRAQVVCLSRADIATAQQRAAIRQRVAALAPQAIWCEVAHSASSIVNASGETQPLAALAAQRVAAFCGIGNPAGFRHTLSHTACEVISWREFPDHHRYTPADLETIAAEAKASNAQLVVCTLKDLVKCRRDELGGLPLWAVAIEMKFLAGQEALEERIRQLIGRSADGR